MMDLRQIKTFVTIVEQGTVSKAALRLRIAQPALSRQISSLEEQLGLKLFDRVGRRLLLTGEGEQLLADCRGLLNYATGLEERAEDLRQGDVGVLKVAATPLHMEGVFSQFLHTFAERYPKVEVRLVEGTGLEILHMLERGEIHLGQMLPYGVSLGEGQFNSCPLKATELLVAYHPSVAMPNRGTIDLMRLASHPLLLLDTGYGLRRAFDAACRIAGLRPKIRLETRSPHTLLALAEANHGVAVIASTFSAARYNLEVARILFRGRPLREPLAILWDKRRPLPRYAIAFCEMWAEHVRKVFPLTRPGATSAARRGPVR